MRLIDADALKHDIKVKRDYTDTTTAVGRGEYIAINTVLTMVDEQPTITPDMAQVLAYECGKNAVAVVMCKDCEWWERFGSDLFGNCECGRGVTDIQFYCKDGERRSE